MSTLNKKWTMYDTSACPRCDIRNETNKHLWECEKATPAVNNIMSNFHQRYHLPDRMQNHILLALQSIATTDLSTRIAVFIKSEQDDPIPAAEMKTAIL